MPRYVEKLRVPVRFALLGEAPAEGFLSLAPHAELHEGPETILERLNSDERVVPMHRAVDDAVLLVTRLMLEWLEAGPDVEARLVRPPTFMTTREERVKVRLVGGEILEGVLPMEMPTEFNRASDFLNGDEDFFAITTGATTRLLNKSRVSAVQLLPGAAESPLPWPHAA